MKRWEYYVEFFLVGGCPEDPETLLRKGRRESNANAQGLNKDGVWQQSWTLLEIAFGKGMMEAEPITREQAAAWVHKWRAEGSILRVPSDLA